MVLRHSFGDSRICRRMTTLRVSELPATTDDYSIRAATASIWSLSKQTTSGETLVVTVSIIGRDSKHRTNCIDVRHLASGRKEVRRPAYAVNLRTLDCRKSLAQQSASEVTMSLSECAEGLNFGGCGETYLWHSTAKPMPVRGITSVWYATFVSGQVFSFPPPSVRHSWLMSRVTNSGQVVVSAKTLRSETRCSLHQQKRATATVVNLPWRYLKWLSGSQRGHQPSSHSRDGTLICILFVIAEVLFFFP